MKVTNGPSPPHRAGRAPDPGEVAVAQRSAQVRPPSWVIGSVWSDSEGERCLSHSAMMITRSRPTRERTQAKGTWMERAITDSARSIMLRAAVAKVGRDELKAALSVTVDSRFGVSTAATNALNALRKHRDPVAAVGTAPYRAVLPIVAATIADACLTSTIEALGDHSEDPTREQLLTALEEVGGSYSDVTIAVMLASVADGGMPASDLCFEILDSDERYGLTDRSAFEGAGPSKEVVDQPARAVTPEQREARRQKKRDDANERRQKMEAARRAGEQVRRARKQERAERPAGSGAPPAVGAPVGGRPAPRLTRRATLTPVQEELFDRDDPWVAGVVFAWVAFDRADQPGPELDGKSRRCVVVAGSPTHLLVRPGYSEGGSKSRDWKSVPLRHWKRAGFDRPTWIDAESLPVPRDSVDAPVGWLTPEDWNALW